MTKEDADEPSHEDEACVDVLKGWMAGDVALHGILSNAVEMVEEHLQLSDVGVDNLLATTDAELGEWVQDQKCQTQTNGLVFYKLHSRCDETDNESNDEYNENIADKEAEVTEEAAMACSWIAGSSSDADEADEIDILVNHSSLRKVLEQSLGDVLNTSEWGDQTAAESRGHGENKRTAIWKYYMGDSLDSCGDMMNTLLDAGDLHNAARVLVACGSFLCDSSSAVKLVKWAKESGYHVDYGDDGPENKDLIHQLLQNEMESIDEFTARTALSFYDEPPLPPAGTSSVSPIAMWLLWWLESGSMSFPTEVDHLWDGSGEFDTYSYRGGKTSSWLVQLNPVCAIFRNNGGSIRFS